MSANSFIIILSFITLA